MIGGDFAAVLARAQDGDEVAFTTLWRDVNPALLRYLKVTGDPADDVASETWMTVVKGLRSFRGDETAWRAWVFTTARRRAVDHGWRRSRAAQVDQEWRRSVMDPGARDAADDALERIDTDEALRLVAQLPDEPTPAVTELLEALTAEARPHELVGLAEPLAHYRADIARPAAATTSTKGTPVFTTLFGARTGAAIAGVAIGLGAVSMVAYAATRPPAETVMISPASTESPDGTPSDRPVGPDATGPAAKGLCNAWANHQKHRDGVERAEGSVAMRNLAAAAGGEDKIAAYCATISHPGKGAKSGKGPKTADEREDADDDERGKPTKPGKDTPTPAEPSPSPSTSATSDPTPTNTHTTATSSPSTPTAGPGFGG